MLKSKYFKYIVMFVLLVLLQVLIFNNISFLGYGTPFLYIYFIIKMPIDGNRSLITLLGFAIGFAIDIFCNTPGVNAAAATLAAFANRGVQGLFFMRGDFSDQEPGWGLLGTAFIKYILLLIFIHHLVLISIEAFSFFNIKLLAFRVLLSSILTFSIILALEGITIKKDKKAWQKTT